jgi:hypothetical protein
MWSHPHHPSLEITLAGGRRRQHRREWGVKRLAWSTTNDGRGEVVDANVWSNVGGQIGLEAPARDVVDYSRGEVLDAMEWFLCIVDLQYKTQQQELLVTENY